MHEPPAVQSQGLTKRFGARAALREIDLLVQPGERLAFTWRQACTLQK